ncbi:hypothetical protein V1512DRAFT_263720 [Lipomyces arxii]|uniref:uncharacterized protein n=1 Tax=Lipomyces arxii TaxID=56418 RepID=UPI0034D0043F
MMRFTGITLVVASTALACTVSAESWADKHMKEEHGLESYDAASLFTLHDSDNSKYWTKQDILGLYGILQPVDPTAHRKEPITVAEQDKVYNTMLTLIDKDNDGSISLEEWLAYSNGGGQLPDFGFGPGHHGDVEYEYEIHHWLKYHANDETDENLNHPEDIEHENLFHHVEDQAIKDQSNNIPLKFRVQK